MAARKSRVKVEILPVIFKKHIAKVCVSMSNNGCRSSLRVEYNSGPFKQFTKSFLLRDPVNNPAASQQFIESYPLAFPMICREADEFACVKVSEATTGNVMPEELVN